ncbi:hypothetical protein MBVG596_0277 [Mycoplasmopsis bovigenitalium]|uniref:hypothetical protein n=1 Tax=Mycoplasmopsis bovigenitalium TaxID=2112 RepID=UPI00090A3F62|nr:hypothetical protein [Mycoplasmopsis bovigenitalium]BAW18127.1 hypothetical protein MBVG596_0277 [Mycoplasmopsis bovigenitalium]
MNILELKSCQINRALAYTLGLIYPLYKEKKLGKTQYILGCVNHNHGKVTQSELAEHYKSVLQLINKDMNKNKPILKSNKTSDHTISPKDGFTVLIEKSDLDTEECLAILTQKVKDIKMSSKDIKREFVKGCFDGRSSWDKTAHYLSIDVDRNYDRQDLIIDIIESLNIKLNVNRRGKNHSKNDQLRIKIDSLDYFMSNIGLYSVCRTNIVKNALQKL